MLDQYMQNKFPNLQLRPPLFYNWDFSIRFELGVDYNYEKNPYLKGVYQRATSLFNSLNKPNDELYIVVDVNDFADGKAFKHKLNIFSKCVKEKSVLFKLQHNTIPYIFPEDNENGIYKTHRFSLKCKVSDINYIPMLKAICNHDMGIKPSISHRVYFININKDTIFHVYDDRGCDLLAASLDTIRDIYEKYEGWILDYDREKIDTIFKMN